MSAFKSAERWRCASRRNPASRRETGQCAPKSVRSDRSARFRRGGPVGRACVGFGILGALVSARDTSPRIPSFGRGRRLLTRRDAVAFAFGVLALRGAGVTMLPPSLPPTRIPPPTDESSNTNPRRSSALLHQMLQGAEPEPAPKAARPWVRGLSSLLAAMPTRDDVSPPAPNCGGAPSEHAPPNGSRPARSSSSAEELTRFREFPELST